MSSTIQAEFKAIHDNQKLLVILIFFFVTVIFWVTASLFKSQSTNTIDPKLLLQATPLNPSINTEVLSEIELKRNYSEAELSSFPIFIRRVENQTISPFSGTNTFVNTSQTPAIVNSLDSAGTTSNPGTNSTSGNTTPTTPATDPIASPQPGVTP